MQKNWQDFLAFMRFVVGRFNQDGCMQIAASLTFTTLLSLVPLLTIALTVFSAFPVFDDFSRQIKVYLLNNLMPDMAGKVITQYMQQFTESAMRLTAVGIAFLAVTAFMMMLTISQAFNTIWRVSRPRPLLKRLLAYWAVLTLAPLLIGASLSLTSWLVGLSMGHTEQSSIFGVGVLKVLPVLFATLAFAMMFRIVPNRYVPRTHALIGAIVAALIFEVMNRAFGYYISHFPTYKLVYGAFASVPIFLVWIYLSWVTILIGAVIAASLSHWRTPVERHLQPAAKLLDALHVLQVMADGMVRGKVSTFPELSRSLNIGYDDLEQLLETLADAGMVRKTGKQGWLMIRDAAHIRVSELLRLFVMDFATLPGGQDDEPVRQWLVACAKQLEQDADLSLQELFARRRR
ncbi:MAG: YihY family inner membrane protein [Nitrosomonadales bacterium]|nr:YihY family inner membrane protein [Nitrosomonadales bacterium]